MARMTSNSAATAPALALVGCGAIAELYYLPALCRRRELRERLVLVDPDDGRRRALAERFGLAPGHADCRAVLGRVAGAILAVPPRLHAPLARDFLESGAHVLCEKPLAETAAEARALVVQAETAGLALAVNHTRRLFPAYACVRDWIARGALGRLKSIRYVDGEVFRWPTVTGFYFRPEDAAAPAPRGVLFDRGVHALDAVSWWLGETPCVVAAETDSFGGAEGTARIWARAGACTIEWQLSWLTKLANVYRVEGERGTLSGTIDGWDRVEYADADGRRRTLRLRAAEKVYMDFAVRMLDNFVEAVEGRAAPLVPAASTLPALELVEASYACATRAALPWYSAIAVSPASAPRGAPARVHAPSPPELNGRPRVLVTGAGGFIGGAVIEGLYLRGARGLRAGVRRWSSAARVARFPVEIVSCDVLDPAQLAAAAAGVDAIVHCAAGPHDVIVGGTARVLEAALPERLRVIHLSTAEVYGPAAGEIDESFPCQAPGSPYAASKIEAERLCAEYQARGVPVTILRPSIVYGPFGEAWTVAYARRLLSGRWAQYENLGDGCCNAVYVQDLVEAVCLALRSERAVGETFNLNGPDRVTWNEYFARFNAALGLPPLPRVAEASARRRAATLEPVRAIARGVLARYGRTIMDIYQRVDVVRRPLKGLKTTLAVTPSRRELEALFARRAHYGTAKAEELLGYRPAYDLARGLAMSVAWLTDQGMVPAR